MVFIGGQIGPTAGQLNPARVLQMGDAREKASFGAIFRLWRVVFTP
jgi:hypothetical protein